MKRCVGVRLVIGDFQIDFFLRLCRAVPGELCSPFAARCSQAFAQEGVAAQAVHGVGECLGIFGGDEKAGFIGADGICQSGDVGAYDGFCSGCGFNGDNAPAFVARGGADKEGMAHEAIFLFGCDGAGEFDAVCDVELIGERSYFAFALRGSASREDEADVGCVEFGKGG